MHLGLRPIGHHLSYRASFGAFLLPVGHSVSCRAHLKAVIGTGLAPLRGPFPWRSGSNHGLGAVAEPPLFVVKGVPGRKLALVRVPL
jgi:hypothetical protein